MSDMTTKQMNFLQNTSDAFIENLEVIATRRSSIEILWRTSFTTAVNFSGYRVHYQKIASSYIQYGPRLSPTVHSFEVQNLVPDTYYNICLSMLRNNTSTSEKCVMASTQSWELPVSVGSSIGAVLALAMIVMLILVIRCRPTALCKRKPKIKASKYDTMSSHCDDDVFEFSPSVTQAAENNTNSEDPNDVLGCQNKHLNADGKGNRDSASGAIPKVPRTNINDRSKQKLYHSHAKYGVAYDQTNGVSKQRERRDTHKTNSHYHDNAIILHVNGDSHQMHDDGVKGDNFSASCSNVAPIHRKYKIADDHQSLDNSISDTSTNIQGESLQKEHNDRIKMLLSFPNADSSAESLNNEYELTNRFEISDSAEGNDIKLKYNETSFEEAIGQPK